MIADRFEALLGELSSLIHKKLVPTSNNAIILRLGDKTGVFLEQDRLGEMINIIIEIGSPQQGPYRENVFREALKANGLPPPRNGIFAYGSKTDSLLLYEQLPLEDLNGPRLLEIMNILIQKARTWKQSIARGEIPSYQSTESTFSMKGSAGPRLKGIFGL
jgi:hypothetical protein